MYDDTNIIDKDPDFSVEETENQARIKIIGVGGGGNNAVSNMYRQNISGVSYVVINTDNQALKKSPVPKKLLIGPETTHGLGAGNKPEVARAAAEESSNEIAGLFDPQTEMVFITAGMGGGTGTGAAPVVARLAKEADKLTVGIVTIPFLFEGDRKILKALNGAEEMKKYVDALMIINNERLTEIYEDFSFMNAMCKADDTLTTAARSISEMITTTDGYINIDMNDVKSTLRESGVAIISTGYGEGVHRVTKAIEDALRSPLLKNRDVYRAKRILLNFYFSNEETENPLAISELNEVRSFMANFDSANVDVIWGAAYDKALGSTVKVTILAAGFEVSIDDEKVVQSQNRKSSSENNDKKVIEETYGKDKVAEISQISTRNKYMVLKPEEMDDDNVIAAFDKPTFKRDATSRHAVLVDEQPAKSADETTGKGPGVKITF